MKRKKLLVADDSLTIQKVIRLALSNEGYDIQAVADGNDASEQLVLFRPDVILVDISLPGKTGIQLKKEAALDPLLKNTKFILMSSAFENVDTSQQSIQDFDGHLVKPFDPANLRQVLSSVLEESSTPSISNDDIPSLKQDLWKDPSGAESSFSLSDDRDIHKLTQETLDLATEASPEDQWKITEPTPIGDKTLFNLREQEPQLPPPPRMFAADDPHGLAPGDDKTVEIFDHSENESLSQSFQIDTEPGLDTTAVPLSTDEMQSLISRQLEDTLEKMARQLLPDIAERVIKKEIHRMLSEMR